MDLFSASKKINHKEMINFFSASKKSPLPESKLI